MALDPSLVLSQSDESVPRLDQYPSHTSYSVPNPAQINPQPNPTLPPTPSSPTLPTNPSSSSSLMNGSQQDDTTIQYPSISPVPIQNGTAPNDEDSTPAGPPLLPDVDPQILEALKSKDRIYVLKLGETFEALIMERKTRVELTPATSYQRLLVHRCSAYYKLAPESDPVTKAIFVLYTADSRIPDRRICELVPAESTAQPSFKIMRRSVQDRRSKPRSHAGSVAGEDGDLSDAEPSESGSLGGRSNVTSSSTKKRMTIEEREAAYNEARSRIFMNFEEKEKNKEKDMSASSSSLSLNGSASTSAGGRSSIGDTDDAASSPATESEWSVPSGSNSRDRKEGRRGGPPSASASSNRSLRSGGSFHANGSGGSSRNSRAPSPSFSYASLHDNAPGHIYDPSQHNLNPNMGYYPAQYYPYSPPGPGPSPPFMPPYPYYHQTPYNPYQPPPPPPVSSHNPSDPTTPSGPEAYSPQHPMGYRPQYGWPSHPNQPPLQSPPLMTIPPPQAQQNPPHPLGPQMQPQSPQYQPFVHPSHAYPYPMNAYYPQPHLPPPPPVQQMPPPPPPPPHMNNNQTQQPQPQHHYQQQPQQPGYDIPRVINNGNPMGHSPSNGHYNAHNGNGPRNGPGNGVIPPNNNGNNNNNGRGNIRNGGSPGLMNNSNGVNGGKHRAQMPPAGRSAWSYGPGVGNGGYTSSMVSAGNEAVGPRFQTHRHVSGNSSSGGNSRSSNNDEVSSTSSSTTSSSSRRTYTSTTSSQQHPLPARPDWAVGLKAQPTLAAMGTGRHLEHSLNNSRTISPISPPRANGHNNSPSANGNGNYEPPISLQATDFPPLTSNGGNSVPEKRTPVVTGAWGQSRPILSAPTTNGANSPSVAGSAQQSPVIKQEDGPKTGETVNGKAVRRPAILNGQVHHRSQSGGKDLGTAKGDTVAGQVSSMSLGGGEDNTVEPSTPGMGDAATATSPAPVSVPPAHTV